MKNIIIFASLVAFVQGNCGCLSCNPHLKVVTEDTSPVKIIIRGDKNVPHPPQQHTCPLVRQYYQSLGYTSLTDAVQEVHNIEVQIPVELVPPEPSYQGLVAAPDRIIVPAQKTCCNDKAKTSTALDFLSKKEDLDDLLRGRYDPYDYNAIPNGNPEYPFEYNKLRRKTRSCNNDIFSSMDEIQNSISVPPSSSELFLGLIFTSFGKYGENSFLYPLGILNQNNNYQKQTCCKTNLNQDEEDTFWFDLGSSKPIPEPSSLPPRVEEEVAYLYSESVNNDEFNSLFYWKEQEVEEPLRELQSLLPIQRGIVEFDASPEMELEERSWYDKESHSGNNDLPNLLTLNTYSNVMKNLFGEGEPSSSLEESFEEEGYDENIPTWKPINQRYKRDIPRIQNRFRASLPFQQEKFEFPWQNEYHKLLKKPGNLHPMVRQRPVVSPTSRLEIPTPQTVSLPNLGKQLLLDIENRNKELRKRLESYQKIFNDAAKINLPNPTPNLVKNPPPKLTMNLTSPAERVAKMREDFKQKLETRRTQASEFLAGLKPKPASLKRKKRGTTVLRADTPFFRVKDIKMLKYKKDENEVSEESEESDDVILQKKREARLEQSLMKPFNAEHIVPHDPIFYLLNFPIRCLDHLNKLKSQISPILHAFPLMLQKSRKYFKDISKDAKSDMLNFGSHVVGSFTRLSPLKNPWDAVTPTKRRYRREVSDDLGIKNLNNSNFNNVGKDPTGSSPVATEFSTILKKKEKTLDGLEILLGKTLWTAGKDKLLTETGTSNKDKAKPVTLPRKEMAYEPLYELVHKNYDPYEDDSTEDKDTFISLKREKRSNSKFAAKNPRVKRAILKLVDEDEVEEYLKEKFSTIKDIPSLSEDYLEENSDSPLLRSSRYTGELEGSSDTKILLEKIVPKIIIDDHGRHFIEINGLKKPLFNSLRNPKSGSPIVGSSRTSKPYNRKDVSLTSIIEKARRYTTDGDSVLSSIFSDSNMHTQAIKNRLSQILEYIQLLLQWDFEEDVHIYEDLLELQNKKEMIVTNWKTLLLENKHNKINEKIVLLKSLKKIQELKDSLMVNIIKKLHEGHTFNTKSFIKFLIMLQKLHCFIVKIAEEFSDNLHIGKFNVDKEIGFVEFLDSIEFFECKNHDQIRKKLQKERDLELEKELAMLEDLKECLILAQSDKKYEQLIFEEAKILWEFTNIEKLQQETLVEMNSKLKSGLKIRKEMKILFDLQKQYDTCEERHTNLIERILKDGGKKSKKVHNGKMEEMVELRRQKLKKTLPIKPRSLTTGLLTDNRIFARGKV